MDILSQALKVKLKCLQKFIEQKSQRYNIVGLKIEEIYTQIFLENKIKEYSASKILEDILY
ncbi:hypothetical protein GIB67_037848 [Kingdonia uniflora]|uniref:Uncharacterized protein n=1 Tax=Kingdonia uniflora TaxID=39325 RepID=A0A7J7LH71_9MAGN|nr:hypothetical protein GIB67_037848 [Kingdonia uniflora]